MTVYNNSINAPTPFVIANGGTGGITQTAAFNNLSPLTTKGDLISFDGTNNVRLAVGTNGYVLTANSGSSSGVEWAPATGFQAAQVRYVDPNGNDTTGNGSISAPYASIGKALTSITDSASTKPYIVSINPGTYSETGLEVPVWVFLVGSMQQPTKIIDSTGAISINSASFSSGSERIGFQNLNLINSTGLTIDFQSLGGSGSNDVYINNCQIVGNITLTGRGSDFLTGNSNQFFGTYTSSAMQEIYFGGYFANNATFNTTGVTNQTVAPEFTGVDLFGGVTFTSSGTGNTMQPTLISSPVSGTLTVDQATTTLFADEVSLNAGTLSQTNGGLVTYLSVAKYEGYTPAVSGNWSPVPTETASALDQLAANSAGKQPLNANLTAIAGLTPSLNTIIYGNGSTYVDKALTGGRVIYVEANGDDTNGDGSILFPYATIYKANSVITTADSATRFIVSIGAGKFIETNNVLLKPYVYYVGQGYTASYIVSPNGTIGVDPSAATQTAFIGFYALYIGSTNNLIFDLNSIGGNFSCVLEMIDVGANESITFLGRAEGADFLEWDSGYSAGGSVQVSNAQGFLNNVSIPGSITLDTANNAGHTLFSLSATEAVNIIVNSTGGTQNATTIAACSNTGTFSASGATTTVSIDAISLPTLATNYSVSGGAVVTFTTSDWGIDSSYTPVNYSPTSTTVDGNFQGIDAALGAIESGGFAWTVTTGTTQGMIKNNGYFANNSGVITYTLPATAAVGDSFQIQNMQGGFTIAQNAGQSIRMGTAISTTGTGGSVASTELGDWITIVCNVANSGFVAKAEQGQFLLT